MITAFSGTSSDLNTTISSRKLSSNTSAMKYGSRSCSSALDVVERGGDAADVRGDVGARGRGGQGLAAQAMDQVDRLLVLRRGRREHLHHRGVVLRVELRWAGEGHTGRLRDAVVDGGEDTVVGARRHLDGEQEWAVEAGTETFGQQVVRTAGGVTGRPAAGVRAAELDGEHGRRHHEQDRQPEGRRRQWPPLDLPAPPVPEAVACGDRTG